MVTAVARMFVALAMVVMPCVVCMVRVRAVAIRLRPGPGIVCEPQPTPCIHHAGGRIVEAAMQKPVGQGQAITCVDPPGSSIKPLYGRIERRPRALVGEVGLGNDDAVGYGDLPAGFAALGKIAASGKAIHDGDHAIEDISLEQRRLRHQRRQDRCRVRKPRRLDDHPLERRFSVGSGTLRQLDEGLDEFAAHAAAQASVRQFDHTIAGRGLDQKLVDARLAEFVDHDGRVRDRRLGKQAVE